MYTGVFNLNHYLLSFVRDDLVDEYEKKCLEVVEKYKSTKSLVSFPLMVEEFNNALSELVTRVQEEMK